MNLLKILNGLDPQSDIAIRIKKATKTQREQANGLGLLLIPVLNAYDNHQTAKRMQDVIVFLQDSEMFQDEEHKLATIETLQIISKSFLGIDLLLVDNPKEVKKSFIAYL